MIGGLDVYIRNVVVYANDKDFDFVIVRGKRDNNKPVVKNGHEVREYPISMYRELNPINDILAVIETIKIIRKEAPDMIHCHSAKGGVIGRLAGFITHKKTMYTPHAFSFLSTRSKVKKLVYLNIERLTRFDSWLLACSESERELGIRIVHYKRDKALVWSNSVPDAAKTLEK